MRISDWSSDVCSSDLIGKAAPPPDDDQARQDEDDRSERPRGAGDRLDDIVLEDVRPAKMPQHRDRYYRRRDRGGKGQAELKPEIHVRSGEQHGDEAAEQGRAKRQLATAEACVGGRIGRSDESGEGKEGVSTGRYGGGP